MHSQHRSMNHVLAIMQCLLQIEHRELSVRRGLLPGNCKQYQLDLVTTVTETAIHVGVQNRSLPTVYICGT